LKGVLALALAFLRTSIRERNALFWFWLFPLLLLAFLGAVFGRAERGELDLIVAVVNLDSGPLGGELQRVLVQPGLPLRLHPLPLGESPEGLVVQARRAVEEGEVHAVLLIPSDFSARLFSGESAQVEILYRPGEAGASTAAAILNEIAEEFGRAFLVRAGVVRKEVPLWVRRVGGEPRTVRYVEFVLPGVILMALLVTGLFSVPDVIVLAKESGVLRRYFATPLSGGTYLGGCALGMALLGAVQVSAVWALGRFAFDVRLALLRPLSLLFLLLAFATSLGLGFVVSALARNSAGAMALANLLNLPLQFLGGLYFPLTGLPAPLRILMAANPLTHLAEGWRASLGLGTSAFPLWLNLLVPLLWLLGGGILSLRRITFVEGR